MYRFVLTNNIRFNFIHYKLIWFTGGSKTSGINNFIANRLCVSCAHTTLRTVTPWPWNLG